MTPAARVAAAIEILADILTALDDEGASADVILKAAWRTRRYAGSKDRAAITEMIYGVLRRRARLVALLNGAPVTARHLMLAALVLDDANIPSLFSGEGYGPPPLTADEHDLLHNAQSRAHAAHADTALELPTWLLPYFRRRFGDRLALEVNALNERASLDIRVNTKRLSLAEAQAQLRQAGIETEMLPGVPTALRARAGGNITATALYRDGLIDIQDAAAQRASLLATPHHGGLVVDLCAGAGGKSLAVAVACQAPLRVAAFDVDARRLAELRVRAARAGADNITAMLLPETGEDRARVLAPLIAKADVVMVDAPCSGTGTWRRNPEAKWRLTVARLAQFTALQARLLQEGAALLKPGGRLVYMTCSVLLEEDEDIVAAFLTTQSTFTLERQLFLSPAADHCDGFYVAVLRAA